MSENEVSSPAAVVSGASPPSTKSRSVFWIVMLVLLCFVGPPTLFGIAGVFWYSRARVAVEREHIRAVDAEVRALEAVKQAQTDHAPVLPEMAPGMGSSLQPGTLGMGSDMGSGMRAGKTAPTFDELTSNMVRVDLRFGKFGSTTVDVLVVDQAAGNEVIYVAPASPFQPRRGKVNGREVVERPVLHLRDTQLSGGMPDALSGGMGGMPGMSGTPPGMPPGMPGAGGGIGVILSQEQPPWESPGTGVCVFRGLGATPPIQLVGDLPEAAVGDQVTLASVGFKLEDSPIIGARPPTITAIGVDVEAQAGRPRVNKAIQVKLAAPGVDIPLGALLINPRHQPVGMVVRIDHVSADRDQPASDSLVLYATPLERIFTTALNWCLGITERAEPEAATSSPPTDDGTSGKSASAAEPLDESDEEWRKLDVEARALAKQASQATGDERTMLLEKLTSVVGRQFERRQQLRQTRIAELEQRLGKLREEHQTREKAKTDEVQKRVETLVPPAPEAQKP